MYGTTNTTSARQPRDRIARSRSGSDRGGFWIATRLSRLGKLSPRSFVKRVGDRDSHVRARSRLEGLPIGMIAPHEIAPPGGKLSQRQRRAEAELSLDLVRRIAAAPGRFAWRRSRRRRGPVCGLVRPIQSQPEPRLSPGGGSWPERNAYAHAGTSGRPCAVIVRSAICPPRLLEGAFKRIFVAVGHCRTISTSSSACRGAAARRAPR
jgi:hypothetical protein